MTHFFKLSIFLAIFFALTLSFVVNIKSEGEFNCPPSAEVSPCTCSPTIAENTTGFLTCSDFNQQQLSNFVQRLKVWNPLHQKLKVGDFILSTAASNLTSLDLSPLTQCNIKSLAIKTSPNLTSILRFSSLGERMNVESIYVERTPLSNSEVANILSYVNSSTSPIRINIEHNSRFTGNMKGSPLIPGLDSFPTLAYLTFVNTSITEVLGSAFAGSRGLTRIDMSNNKIRKLGKDAFRMDQSGDLLYVYLDNNILQSDSSSIESGFIPEGSATFDFTYTMSIQNNNLTTLPEATFKNLLYPGGRLLGLSLKGNQFECDDRMQWIKSGKDVDKWGNVVKNVDCTNDPGKTIFTTDLVQAKSGANSLFQLNGMNFIILLCTIFPFALFN